MNFDGKAIFQCNYLNCHQLNPDSIYIHIKQTDSSSIDTKPNHDQTEKFNRPVYDCLHSKHYPQFPISHPFLPTLR